jgi:hypothetical protein
LRASEPYFGGRKWDASRELAIPNEAGKEIRNVYYPAAEAFLKATLKADRVFIFDHIVRKRVEGAADVRGGGPRQPATRVHVDQTDASGANRVREHLPEEAD